MNEEYEFTLGGERYRITRRQFEDRLVGVASAPIKTHSVEIGGHRYPVKQAVAIGVGINGYRSSFISTEALRILRKLGYKPDTELAASNQEHERKKEFILSGTHHRVARRDFEQRFVGVEPENITKYSVEIGGRHYPVKQAIGVGLGVERLSFTTMDAFRILRKLGFKPESSDRIAVSTRRYGSDDAYASMRALHRDDPLSARYWVYENWQAEGHKAIIHHAACGHCKNGIGQKGGTDKAHGQWLGPYATVSAAEVEARKTGGAVRRCKMCQRLS